MRALFLLLVLGLLAWVLFLRTPAGPDVGTGRGSYTRLELRPLSPQPPVESKLQRQLIPVRSLEGWQGEATGKVAFTRAKPTEEKFDSNLPPEPQRIPSIALSGEGPKRLGLPGTYDPTTFNQILVLMANYGWGPESVRVVLEREGDKLLSSPWLALSTSKGFAQPTLFDLPQTRRLPSTPLSLALEFKGNGSRTVTVSKVELWKRPARAFLPRADQGSALVTIAGEERRGVGITSAMPLSATFTVPPEGELAFSYGLVPELRIYGEKPRLTLRLLAGDEEVLRKEYDLESRRSDRAHWHSERLDLSPWSEQELEARFELSVAGERLGLAIVAEAAISHRGEHIATVTLITSDTHRGDHLSATGDRVETPVLDALAGRGVLFENALSSTNVTNPSHVALMTATTPRDTHILNNNTPLSPAAVTLAERFAEEGYRTFAALSASHLRPSESGLGQGFDRVNGPLTGERKGSETLDVLEGWLRDAAGQPLFVWLHLFDAHAPYQPPARYAKRYWQGGDPYAETDTPDMPPIEIPPFLEGLTDKAFPYAMYRGEVDFVDELIGRLLEQERIAKGILAFTGDHGESFGEHGVWWDHADLYPETTHVPLILVWPGGPAGIRSDAPVEMIDIGRTLLDLSGLEQASFPGRDLRWGIDDPAASQARFQLSAHGFVASVVSGKWQLHLHLRRHKEWAIEEWREEHEVELFDLEKDPGSLHNLARDPAYKERARRLRQAVIDWLGHASAHGLDSSKMLTESALESLKGMGYSGEESSSPTFVSDPENEWDRYFEE